jgi:hypothetical protein
MSAVIIDLAAYRATAETRATPRHTPVLEQQAADATSAGRERFQFWTGSSGRRYVHTVYNLIDCPALPQCNYMLVRRDEDGVRQIVDVNRATSETSTLNLAEIRMKGARLGATEVHVHLLASSAREAKSMQSDLQAGLVVETLPMRKRAGVK